MSEQLMRALLASRERIEAAATELREAVREAACESALDVVHDAQQKREERDCEAPRDRAACELLLRAAAFSVCAHEEAVTRVETVFFDNADKKDGSSDTETGNAAGVAGAADALLVSGDRLVRALHDAAVLWDVSAKAGAKAGAIARAAQRDALVEAIKARDARWVNLGLVLLEANDQANADADDADEFPALVLFGDSLYSPPLPSPLLHNPDVDADVDADVLVRLLTCRRGRETAGMCDADGNTALMFAAGAGCESVVRALLQCDAVRASAGTARPADKATALICATRRGHAAVVALLLTCKQVCDTAGGDHHCATAHFPLIIDDMTTYPQTPLMVAAASGNAELCRTLLTVPAVRATAGFFDGNGHTALMQAISYGNTAVVRVLLACDEVRANAGDLCDWNHTPLTLASAIWDDPEMVAELLTCKEICLTAGARVGRIFRATALMYAMAFNRAAVVPVLLTCSQVRQTAGPAVGTLPLVLLA